MYAVLHLRTTSGVTPFSDQLQYFQSRSYPLTAAFFTNTLPYLRVRLLLLLISPVAGVGCTVIT